MEISQIDILTLLPQKPPFIMIDRLMQCDSVITRTEFLVKEDHLFFHNGTLIDSGVVENIAQTCAARMGYVNSILNAGDVKVGFIGAIKNLNIYKLPELGSLMKTEIEVKSEVFNILLVTAKVWVNMDLVAECEMKIAEQ